MHSLLTFCAIILATVKTAESFSHARQKFMKSPPPASASASISINRQAALRKMAIVPLIISQVITEPSPAQAKVSIKPDGAFQGLVKAREELQGMSKTYIATKDYDGLRDYLADPSLNINNYEENAGVLLASKQLDAESKKEIGTIRRYGVGADVIIMFGGLKAELEEEEINYGTVSKSLKRTIDSLDEVIAICKSNGF